MSGEVPEVSTQIEQSIRIGYAHDAGQPEHEFTQPSDEEVAWLSAWLAGEGWTKQEAAPTEQQGPRPSTTLAERVLRATATNYTEGITWGADPDDLSGLAFYVPCADLFVLGASDTVRVTEDNIDLLEQTISECEERFGRPMATWTPELFCARAFKAQVRPSCLASMLRQDDEPSATWRALFAAAASDEESHE